MGSSMTDVEAMIHRNGWKLDYISTNAGFYDQRTNPPRQIGMQSIRGELGEYRAILLSASVSAFWGFDREGKLIDLWVWKTWDGP